MHRSCIDRIDRTCVVVMALCNQPEAFASDFDDDQSRYLFVICLLYTSDAADE